MRPAEAVKRRERRRLRAAARFFVRIGQAGTSAKQYDEYSLPLFPFTMLMDAEGLLAADARHIVERYTPEA